MENEETDGSDTHPPRASGEWLPLHEARFAFAPISLLQTHAAAAWEFAWAERIVADMRYQDVRDIRIEQKNDANLRLNTADCVLWQSLHTSLSQGNLQAKGTLDPVQEEPRILRAEVWQWLEWRHTRQETLVQERKLPGLPTTKFWHCVRICRPTAVKCLPKPGNEAVAAEPPRPNEDGSRPFKRESQLKRWLIDELENGRQLAKNLWKVEALHHFTDMTDAAWGEAWSHAAEKYPDISKAGRKAPRNQIGDSK